MNLQLLNSKPNYSGKQRKVLCHERSKSRHAKLIYKDSSYPELVDRLSDHALDKFKRGWGRRMVVGIAGAPGSGKSTLASAVSKRVNEKIISLDNPQKSPSPSYFTTAIAIPMDGFHYYKRELDQFPDVKKAYERRGAPWTFNASSFVSRMRQLKADAEVHFPSFEHALGDPKEDDISLEKCHRIVFVEGNYLLLDQNPWSCLKDERIFDESWFLDVSLDDAMARVLRRQLRMGTAEDIAEYRIRTNDRPNGELINESKKRADVLIQMPFDTAL